MAYRIEIEKKEKHRLVLSYGITVLSNLTNTHMNGTKIGNTKYNGNREYSIAYRIELEKTEEHRWMSYGAETLPNITSN